MVKKLNYLLTFILLWLIFSTVVGNNGYRDLILVREKIAYQKNLNQELAQINARLQMNLQNIKQQKSIVEALARRQLMMVKKDEVFFRILK